MFKLNSKYLLHDLIQPFKSKKFECNEKEKKSLKIFKILINQEINLNKRSRNSN